VTAPDPSIMLARIPVLDCAATLSYKTEGLRNYLKDQRSAARPAVLARSATPYNTVPAI